MDKFINRALLIVAILMAGYQLLYTQYFVWIPGIHRVVHLGLAMVVIVLVRLRKKKINQFLALLLLVVSIGVTLFFALNYKRLELSTVILPVDAMIAGSIAVVLVFYFCWREMGALFPIFALISIAYISFGYLAPEPFKTPRIPLDRIIGWIGGDVSAEWGIYGSLLSISANYLFLFIFFGSMLHAFGGMRFIKAAGSVVAARLRSGPAALCVITSALIGSITGSTVANISMVGSFTIPMMKGAGYKPENAAALELAASNGGQILPPIMGATAFVMAGFIGVPYIEIAKASFVPAIIYFAVLLLYAELQARKLKLAIVPFKINFKELLLDAPNFVIPLGILSYMMIAGYSLVFTIFWGVVSIVAAGLLSALRKDIHLDWKDIGEKTIEGTASGAQVAITVAIVAIVVAAIQLTGFAIQFSDILVKASHGNIALLLLFNFIAGIILGMGLPTVAVYILVATVLAPALVAVGVPVLLAHLFTFFFACQAHLTPPIGIGLIVATKMANSHYWKTGFESLKCAFVAFLIPFIFVYAPAIILSTKGMTLTTIIGQFVATLLSCFTLQVALSQQLQAPLKRHEVVLFYAAAIITLLYVFIRPNYLFILAGIAITAVAVMLNVQHASRLKAQTT